MSRSQCTKSGLGAISTVEDIETEINGLGVLPCGHFHIPLSFMTLIDISCTTFIYLILENTLILTKTNDDINSGSD